MVGAEHVWNVLGGVNEAFRYEGVHVTGLWRYTTQTHKVSTELFSPWSCTVRDSKNKLI